MLDIRLIRDNPDSVKARLAARGGDAAERVDEVLELDKARRTAETRLQQLQADRKRLSKEIGAGKGRGEDTAEREAQVRGIGEEISRLEEEASGFDARQRELLLMIPNVPHEAIPVGKDAADNPELRSWGQKPELSFPARSHVDLAEALGLFDFPRATRMSGSAFVAFTGAGARLERSLINFLLDLHTSQHGYTEIMPPVLMKPEALIGTTQLPKFEDQLYKCEPGGLYLAPTAEVPVTNLHREELLPYSTLPIRYAAHTPCFRSEAGAAGLGTRGLIRMHQFDKVELVKITTPETSFAELETLTADAEKVLQLLGLHYRVIELCSGDLGFGSTRTYDIEVWAPGQNAYLEVSSCSNFGDYQARRMALRFKDAEGKNRFCHTLNGSGTALPRLYVALLETYQQADGSIALPEPLWRYFGSERITR
jgi:seryl-tRNA synthetase